MPDVIARAATMRVVLLGEDHPVMDDHRWQLHVIAALAGRVPTLTLGFEMFPRRVQAALDRWSAGALDPEAFLVAADWTHSWGFDPALYWPLFHFARIQRVAMIALNVDRTLVRRVAAVGWDGVPADAREGLSRPAPPSPRYRDRLIEAWRMHDHDTADDPAAIEHFIEAQLVWDRAMAEAIRTALDVRPGGTVIGVMGRGHVEQGDGVPAQLATLGVANVLALVPWPADRPCTDLAPGVADYVFGIAD